MADLRVTYFRKVLPVTKMVEIPGPPHHILLYGPDPEDVLDVEINGVRGYSFSVTSGAVDVELPDLLTVRTVALLGGEMGILREATVEIGFTTHLTTMRGMQLLVQNWLKCFFTKPGSDLFSREWGGGGNRLVGSVFADESEVNTAAAVAVRRTNQTLLQRQAGNLSIPREERLLNAKLLSIQDSPGDQAKVINVEIMNQSGETARVGLG